jgi:predicted O-linked N-acetylglucosamine transferase (SPINDLY family)
VATPPDFADWLERGRAHQQAGRPIDAIPCFVRAARLEPRASDASFHLGEVYWQLGMPRDALAAWQEAVRRAPDHAAARLALAEALLHVGDEAGAHAAAEAALAVLPDEFRARVIRAVSQPYAADGALDVREIAALAAHDIAPFAAPAIARALSRRWSGPAEGDADLARTLAPVADRLPWPLLVALARHGVHRQGDALRGNLWRLATERDIAPDDIDALRELATIAFAGQDAAAGQAIAERYAQLSMHAFAPPYPLVWTLRAAGAKVRVAVLATGASAPALRTLVAAVAPVADAFETVVWIADPGEIDALPVIPRAAVRRWTGPLDLEFAKAIADDDPDLLVDTAGLAAPIGRVVGAVPARRFLSLAAKPFPLGAVTTPADAAAVDASRVRAWLDAIAAETREMPSSDVDAAALRAQWEHAIRVHREEGADAAREAYDAFLALQPECAPARFLRGVVLRDAGDRDAAASEFDSALATAPDYRDARVAAMRLAAAMRDGERLRQLARDGLARLLHPDPVLLRVLGECELALGDSVRGGEALRQALALAPGDPDTHYNLGVAAQMRRDADEAARAYQRALVLDPDHVASHFNMAVLFEERGRLDAARGAYENVLRRDPKRAAAYKNLGELLARVGDLPACFANFARFEAACPGSMLLAVHGLEVCQLRGDFAGVERFLEGLRHERFKAADEVELADCMEQLLFLVLNFDVEPEMALRLAMVYDAAARKVYGEPLPRHASRREGPLRIGYLSGDLRNHVMGKQVWQALQHHDRSRFELYFFSTSPVRDDWTARFEGIAHAFVDVHALCEREAALRIDEADLDLLVDLSTHTKGGKPGILAFKPARVQVTHIAAAGPVGLSTVDFKLTDRYADLPESAEYQLEPFLAMEGCVYPYRRTAPAAEHPFHRGPLGIAATDVVIGAFVQPLKLSRRCLTLWRDVLQRIPQAKLAFSPYHPALREAVVRLAAAAGIGRERLIFLPQGRDDAENQARYAVVDFVLDTMPYGGVNGVIEPLDMGIPVVTLLGRRHGERSAYSILANLGVTDTVAQTRGEYVEIAARLAFDTAFRDEVRAKIRAGITHSALVDMPAHTRHLEDAYLRAIAAKAPEALAAARAPMDARHA